MRTVTSIIILILTINFCGCGEKSQNHETDQVQKESFSVRDGRSLYNHYCAPCHGESGDGFGQYLAYGLEPSPPDFTTPGFFEERSDKILFLTISEGTVSIGKSNLCPPWGKTFRKEEISFLVGYVKHLNEIANADKNSIELTSE